MTGNDSAELGAMHPADDDLIRRGDALAAIKDAFDKGRDGRGGIHCAVVQVPAAEGRNDALEAAADALVELAAKHRQLQAEAEKRRREHRLKGDRVTLPGYIGMTHGDLSSIYQERADAVRALKLRQPDNGGPTDDQTH